MDMFSANVGTALASLSSISLLTCLVVGFKPTLDYPFQVTDEIVHAGGWAHRANEHAHGRHENVATRKMMTTDEHGQAGDVQAQDVSQVSRGAIPTTLRKV